MKMETISKPSLDLKQFIELVLMWFCSGDIPMSRVDTQLFIECEILLEFVASVHTWCESFGLRKPSKSEIIQTLHLLHAGQ